MLEYGKTFYSNIFKSNICGVCELCKPTQPSFCMVIYGGDRDRFFKLLKYLNVLHIKSTKTFNGAFTFEGFCGIFCNTGRCPKHSGKCNSLDERISCYEAFVEQSGSVLTQAIRSDIYRMFSGIEVRKIGKSYQLKARDPLKLISKRLRSKVKAKVKTARDGMKSSLQTLGSFGHNLLGIPNQNAANARKVSYVRKKKLPKTELFCNDDGEWRAKIDEYLGQNETNNRQSAESAQCAKGH